MQEKINNHPSGRCNKDLKKSLTFIDELSIKFPYQNRYIEHKATNSIKTAIAPAINTNSKYINPQTTNILQSTKQDLPKNLSYVTSNDPIRKFSFFEKKFRKLTGGFLKAYFEYSFELETNHDNMHPKETTNNSINTINKKSIYFL